jgi:DNA-binding NarL/FixJ family response regulator
MPSLDGLDATREILKANAHTKIVILSIYDSEQLIERVLNSGAWGYVRKADTGRDLVRAVQALLNRQTFLRRRPLKLFWTASQVSGQRRQTVLPRR